jgi:hypothetical protein
MQRGCSVDVEEVARAFAEGEQPSFPAEEATRMRELLLSWFHISKRSMPWRGDAVEGVCKAMQVQPSAAEQTSRSAHGSRCSHGFVRRGLDRSLPTACG